MNGFFTVPEPKNEVVKSYAPGSPERAELKAQLAEYRSQEIDIPMYIGGKEVRTGNTKDMFPNNFNFFCLSDQSIFCFSSDH